jgi:hypothetical protein
MTHNEAVTLVALLRAAYPGQAFPDETAALYVAELTALPAKETTEQVRSLIRQARRWPPSIGEVVEPVARRALGIPTSAAAWLEVERNARCCHWRQHEGWDPEPTWSHAAVTEALQGLGGLEVVQASSQLTVERAQFTRLYEDLAAAALGAELGRPSLSLLGGDDDQGGVIAGQIGRGAASPGGGHLP